MALVESLPSREQGSRLTDEQKERLRVVITRQLSTYRARADRAAAALDDFTSGDSPHEREVVRLDLERWLAWVEEHEDALTSLHAGTYGVCTVCDQAIPFERLEAIPEVRHCVGCIPLA